MSLPPPSADTPLSATDFSQYAGLRAAAQRNDPKALRQAAQQFEALFTQMMLKQAHQTQFGDDLTGQQGEFYKDMFDQQLAMQMASGHGLGLADMLVRQLGGRNSADVSAPVAGQSSPAATAVHAGAAAAYAAGQASGGAHWRPASVQEFVDAVRPHAEKAAAELGVPARALIAQAALETGWGQHMAHNTDGSQALNLFGIKAQAGYAGAAVAKQTSEFAGGTWSTGPANFRSYHSLGAAFDDYVKLLKNNPRYADALRAGDVRGFAQGLQRAGYATDPQYARKLEQVAYSAQLSGAYGAGSTVTA
ncbi:MAG: flagellar assembly peptidoglycan hydrolase FlgJ [Nevskia sp.]|nr:flagellar assembly peptidoglycan hydrolase FlgJ [Nevskia sp.]